MDPVALGQSAISNNCGTLRHAGGPDPTLIVNPLLHAQQQFPNNNVNRCTGGRRWERLIDIDGPGKCQVGINQHYIVRILSTALIH